MRPACAFPDNGDRVLKNTPVIPESAQRLSGTQGTPRTGRKAAFDQEVPPSWVPALRAPRSGRDDGRGISAARPLAAALSVALVLGGAGAARAAGPTFLEEFQAICLANADDSAAAEATARARGFKDKPTELPASLGKPVTLIRNADGLELAVLITRIDGPAHVKPPMAFAGCTVSGYEFPDSQQEALARWAEVPANVTPDHTTYRFRLRDGRKTPVGLGDRELERAVGAGGLYVLDVMRMPGGVSLSLLRVTPKP